MASPGQKRGVCGHFMAGFHMHAHCAMCRDKLKCTDPCVNKKDCPHCDVLTSEQKLQLSTPYQKKKEKHEQKTVLSDKSVKADKSEDGGDMLVDPILVSVIGLATTDKKAVKSPERKKKHSPKKSSTDLKSEGMDQKWSEHFSRLQMFLLS